METNVKIEKVVIDINGKKIELTWEEVLELKKALEEIHQGCIHICPTYSPPYTITYTGTSSTGGVVFTKPPSLSG